MARGYPPDFENAPGCLGATVDGEGEGAYTGGAENQADLDRRSESRREERTLIERILVPLDGSKMAETILPHVEYLARLTKAEVILLCIAVPLRIYTDHVVTYPVDERAQLEEAREYVESVAASLREKGLRAEAVARYGSAADEIVNFAQEADADLIAMSTHGRSGLGRWVFGSVAEKVLRASATPILLLKPDGQVEESY